MFGSFSDPINLDESSPLKQGSKSPNFSDFASHFAVGVGGVWPAAIVLKLQIAKSKIIVFVKL